MKLESYHYRNPYQANMTRIRNIVEEEESESEVEGDVTLANHYSERKLVYKKWDNSDCRTRSKRSYLSSIFFGNIIRIP